MTNVLDDILAVAQGGMTATKLTKYLTEWLGAASEMDAHLKALQAQVDTHGMYLVIGRQGYEISVGGKVLSEEHEHFSVKYHAAAGSTTISLTDYYIMYVTHMLAACEGITQEGDKLVGRVRIPKIVGKLKHEQPAAIQNYIGKTVVEVKAALQAEVKSALTLGSYEGRDKFFLLHSVVRCNYSSIPKMCDLGASVYRNLTKVLYPTIKTRDAHGLKDRELRYIAQDMASGAHAIRDFGIKDLDKLYYVYSSLLRSKFLLKAEEDWPKLKSHKVDDMVEFIQAMGGTLHGGKVGARKNFNKKENKDGETQTDSVT